MSFEEWLVSEGYVSDASNIVYELSAVEADELWVIWSNK